MPPVPPDPDHDHDDVLDRLAAAGPVLDDLYRDAADGHSRRGRHAAHRRGRRAIAVAAAVLAIAAVAVVATLASSDDPETMRTDDPTTSTTIPTDAQLTAIVATRLDGMRQCGPLPERDQVPVTWPADWELVSSPECLTGYVAHVDPPDPVPVYAQPRQGDPIAYWSPDTGWIAIAEYRDDGFDLDRYRAAYQAEVARRADAAGTSTSTGN